MERYCRNGLTFDVRDAGPGDGDVAVLLHGFPQTAAAWDRVEPLLHDAGLRTLAPDQRGYAAGARPSGRREFALRELAADVLTLLDAAGVAQAHVVGHDWGGAVAWWLASHHPDRVATLTVLSTPHPRAMAISAVSSAQLLRSWYVGFFQLPWLPERLLGGGRRLGSLLRQSGLDEAHARTYEDAMAEPGALTAALDWYRALPFDRPDGVPGRIPVPTRYVWGGQDRFLGRRAAELTGRYVEADYRLIVLPDAGHWLPECHPDDVAAATIELTRSHPLGR